MKASPVSGSELQLVSMYLQPTTGRTHGIVLRLGAADPHGVRKGTLTYDPNTCSLDLWGDRAGCTKMAGLPIDVEVQAVRLADPAGHGRTLHQVTSADIPTGQLNLIEYPAAGLWSLVQVHEGKGTSVVPLFPAKLFAPKEA